MGLLLSTVSGQDSGKCDYVDTVFLLISKKINYANVMGLQADTNTTASQFSYLALVFYVSYLFCEPIHAYLMQRYPTAKYLGTMVTCWGIVALGTDLTFIS